MRSYEITLKNYRCFADDQPLMLALSPGITSFVGVNNAGKSTILRFFFELRGLFEHLRNGGNLWNMAFQRGRFHAPLVGLDDPTEAFCSMNDRPLTLDFAFAHSSPAEISSFELVMERQSPNYWQPQFYVGPSHEKISGADSSGGINLWVLTSGAKVPANVGTVVELFDTLARSVYIGPFRNAISQGGGRYFDLDIGTSFVQAWDDWKTGQNRKRNLTIKRVTDDIAHIFDFSHLEINATPSRTDMQVFADDRSSSLRELGAGLSQFIVSLGTAAIQEPQLLLIDEPEANLHPSLQADFLMSLASHAGYATLFATHSVGLARTTSDRILVLRKAAGKAVAHPFEQMPNLAEFLGEMSFSTFKEIGGDAVLLVEGVTDVKLVRQFLRLFKLDHSIIVLPLGGTQLIRGGVQEELFELKRLSEHIAVLIDSERAMSGGALQPNREAFLNDCKALGFRAQATERRALDNYLSEQAIQRVKGTQYRALSAFGKLSEAERPWAKSDSWRIAREMSLADLSANDVGAFLGGLGDWSLSEQRREQRASR